ncbi:MAG: hypothetical protein FJZ47_13920 [Candidatus Tectomicrobia bacterium]|uniref:Cytochrome c-552/4 domain-containing protein n=1 Tax=Tectimicrobiota bacterium TaxID=2528274 RepID=A0A937W107_UNCTE|nr:hypothetical protein [Candidatus Tectomicrobia bacterium]
MRQLGAAAIVVLLVLGVLRPPHSVGQTPAPMASSAAASKAAGSSSGVQRYFYLGGESCASSGCHGSATPRKASRSGILQNEHAQWLSKDKHAKAYEVLLKPRSLLMAKNLKMSTPPSQSERCLVCHTLYVPKEVRGPTFKLEEGVSCEACHGQSEGWLGLHIGHGHTASLGAGMYDTRNLVKRAEKCASCHIGDATRNVDHELIAAGHPDLVFDLETYTNLMPQHWRTVPGDGIGGRAWAIGQVVALRESLKRLAQRTQQRAATAWPEFAEFECFACHHDVNNIESSYYRRDRDNRLQDGDKWDVSWRQQRGYSGVAGLPPWNPARYFVLRQVVQALAPESRVALDQELNTVSSLMMQVGASDPAKIAAAANRAAQVADSLLPRVANLEINADLASMMVRNITSDSGSIAGAGPRVAEQAAMALQTFVPVARKAGRPLAQDAAVAGALQKLAQVRDTPEALNNREQFEHFVTQMRAIHSFLTQP